MNGERGARRFRFRIEDTSLHTRGPATQVMRASLVRSREVGPRDLLVYGLYTKARMKTAWVLALVTSTGCIVGTDGDEAEEGGAKEVALNVKRQRYEQIREAARGRGMSNAFLLAGIANDETNLAMCWSEATWACQGPASPDCGGGPIIAGSADGPCGNQQGGLGMFQFDAGTYQQTIKMYGADVLTTAGQTSHAIDYAVWMVKVSAYTTDAETDAKAFAWINRFDPNNAALRDQWIKTVVRYYNGCQPGWSCWNARYQTYSDGYRLAIDEP